MLRRWRDTIPAPPPHTRDRGEPARPSCPAGPGKSDPLDAESAARRALAGEDQVTPKDTTTIVEAIRVLRIARTGAVKSRTAAFNQLKDLIITAPDSLRETLRDKTLHRVAVESARLRPDTSRLADPSQATKLALRTIAVRVAALNTEITALDTHLANW